MQQVTFRSLSIEGFKSYCSPVQFKFANTGLHLIKGLNGEGKSSLFSALVWCLYKVNLNNTNNTRIPTFKWKRTPSYKGTRVQVVFGIGKYKYLVARHIAYKGTTKGLNGEDSLLIFKKDKSIKESFTSADILNDQLYKEDAQAYLNKLLGIDSKTFLNSVLFGQRMSRLMDSKDADKRDLFERLFDVEFIDHLKDKAVSRGLEAQTALQQLQADHTTAVNSQALLQQQLDSANDILAEFADSKKQALDAIRSSHSEAKAELEVVKGQIESAQKRVAKSGGVDILSELREASDKAREAYYTAKEELSNIQRDLSECERDFGRVTNSIAGLWEQIKKTKTSCGVCGAKLSVAAVAAAKEKIEEEIKEKVLDQRRFEQVQARLTKSRDVAENTVRHTMNVFTAALDAYNAGKQTATPNPNNELLVLQQKNALLSQKLKQLKASFDAEKERKPPTINIEQINSQLASVEAKLPDIAKSIRIKTKYIERLSWWQKNAFGANGLKSYVFSASLNRLNECVSAYTNYFGLSVVFGIDLSKTSKPFYCRVMLDGVNEVDYDTLSGGEKQKVDLSIAFGLQDAAEVRTSFNICVLDEPEGNLDGEVLEVFDTLLRIRAERKAVYVISHNSQMDLSGATIYTITGGKNSSSTIE